MKSYYIHFIRHGLTKANVKGQYIGITDIPLSLEGRYQLGKQVEDFEYPYAEIVYTSPLKRCLETCDIIYPNVNPIVVDDLSECNFGEWEGKTVKELENNSEFKKWLDDAQNTPPPSGESGLQFAKRVCTCFEKIVEGRMRSRNTNAVIVTHGGVIMTILATYGIPRAKSFDWIVDNGFGYSIRINPGLWMRDMVAEVYAKIPNKPEQLDGEIE